MLCYSHLPLACNGLQVSDPCVQVPDPCLQRCKRALAAVGRGRRKQRAEGADPTPQSPIQTE